MKFPLLEKKTDLGKISDPKIPVAIKTAFGFEPYLFLLDTGADFTMIPSSFAALIGLSLNKLPRTKTYGIEGRGVSTWVAPVMLKIGSIPFEATVLMSSDERTPLILGRQGLFDRFNVSFDNRNRKISIVPMR